MRVADVGISRDDLVLSRQRSRHRGSPSRACGSRCADAGEGRCEACGRGLGRCRQPHCPSRATGLRRCRGGSGRRRGGGMRRSRSRGRRQSDCRRRARRLRGQTRPLARCRPLLLLIVVAVCCDALLQRAAAAASAGGRGSAALGEGVEVCQRERVDGLRLLLLPLRIALPLPPHPLDGSKHIVLLLVVLAVQQRRAMQR